LAVKYFVSEVVLRTRKYRQIAFLTTISEDQHGNTGGLGPYIDKNKKNGRRNDLSDAIW
jgi:hypothetical protein